MKNKRAVLFVSMTAILLAALFALSLCAGRQGYENLLLIVPAEFGAPGFIPEKLEEFSDEEFLLTYEIRQAAMVRAVVSAHSATLVGTNHNYAGMMGYACLDGGFFTKAAVDAQSRHAVLNETAAFQLFGSSKITGNTLKMNNETWIVTGVIDDNDTENANIYVPAGTIGGQAASLMVLTDQAAVTEAYAKNALKGIGVHENSYAFINVSRSASAYHERFWVAMMAAVFAAALLFGLKTSGRLLQKLRFYRDRMRQIYLRELLVCHRADIRKTIAWLLALAAGVAAILALSLNILAICLTWQEIVPITGELAAGDFGAKLVWLRDWQATGVTLFVLCIGAILAWFFLLFRAGQRQRDPIR